MNKRKVGQRGPDKKKRKYGGGAQVKPDEEKAKNHSISLYDWEKEIIVEKYGSLTKPNKILAADLLNKKNKT